MSDASADKADRYIETARRFDAEALDCTEEIKHTRTICERGTSADRQLAVYHGALGDDIYRSIPAMSRQAQAAQIGCGWVP